MRYVLALLMATGIAITAVAPVALAAHGGGTACTQDTCVQPSDSGTVAGSGGGLLQPYEQIRDDDGNGTEGENK